MTGHTPPLPGTHGAKIDRKASAEMTGISVTPKSNGTAAVEINKPFPRVLIEVSTKSTITQPPTWPASLVPLVSVVLGGLIAAAASWWSSRNQTKAAIRNIAAQVKRDEMVALREGLVKIDEKIIPSDGEPQAVCSAFLEKYKVIRPISHFLGSDLELELREIETKIDNLSRICIPRSPERSRMMLTKNDQQLDVHIKNEYALMCSKIYAVCEKATRVLVEQKRNIHGELRELIGR